MRALNSLLEVADAFDAIVLDQWGVLHNGTTPYGGALATLNALQKAGPRLAVLSNSGKRAAPNLARIAGMGFDASAFEAVMTSGEALWQDIAGGRVATTHLYPIERAAGDAVAWANGLDVTLVSDPKEAQAILLMGLPDGVAPNAFDTLLTEARHRALPVLCTNPDRASPRAGGEVVTSPGALAHAYAEAGGPVQFYGKPHAPIYRSLEVALDLPPDRVLMVGDSLEHDIAGAANAGWSSLFIRGGLHAAAFTGDDVHADLAALAAKEAAPMPGFTLWEL